MYTPFLFNTSEQDLRFVLLQKKAIEAFPMHWHDEIEISYVLHGELQIFLNGELITVKEGDALFIDSDECHYFMPGKVDLITVLFSPSLLSGTPGSDKLIADIKERLTRNSKTTAKWTAENKSELKSIIDELASFDKNDFAYELKVRACIFRLVAMIADERINSVADMTAVTDCSKVKERIGNVFRYIEEHYMEALSLPEAAAASGYVPTYFSRVFKTCTGMTFYDYLTIYRIRKSEVLLVETSDSIAAIAVASGFSSVKTFDRVFKEQIGISPLKFRKQHMIRHAGQKRKGRQNEGRQ